MPELTAVADHFVVAPVRWNGYKAGPGWYGAYRYPGYYAYRPRSYWYGQPGYYGYYAPPYPVYPWGSYYYPNGIGFQYVGPRRSFRFVY